MCCCDLLQNCDASLKATGIFGLQESLGLGCTEKLENANPKGSSIRPIEV